MSPLQNLTAILLLLCSIPVLSMSLLPENSVAAQEINEKHIDMPRKNDELLASLSREEREWYEKFQNGMMLFSGWREISDDILHALPPEKRPRTKELLHALGVRIGTEWSKDNDIRKIDTDMLRSWGKHLKNARKAGPQQLLVAVQDVASEVNRILTESGGNREGEKLGG